MCAICRRRHGVQVHHIVPRLEGGSDDISNAIPLCPNCHDVVHRATGSTTLTRAYTPAELRQHLRLTVEHARTAGPDDRNWAQEDASGGSATSPRAVAELPIFHVPHLPNPYFIGRRRELRILRRRLLPVTRVPRHALIGVAGVGKTQLAAEYAHSVRGERDVVWWLRTEHSTTLIEDLVALADALELPSPAGSDASARLRSLHRWLETTAVKWLLVFDNAEAPSSLTEHLPSVGNGQIVITSQRSQWDRVATVVPVAPLSTSEAVAFLARRTGTRRGTETVAVAEALGGLCLALEHVGAFVRETSLPFGNFIALLAAHGFSAADGPVLGHPKPLAAVWSATLAAVQEQRPLAITILELLSLVDPDRVPRALLTRSMPTTQSTLELHESLRELAGYSLIEAEGPYLSVHRLLALYVREHSAEHLPARIASLVTALRDALPSQPEDPRAWEAYGVLTPHARAVARHATADVDVGARRQLGALLVDVGLYLNARARHASARDCLTTAIRRFDDATDAGRGVVLRALVALARVERNLGDYVSALDHLEQAESLCADDADSELRAAVLTVFGRVLHDLGRMSEARTRLEQSVALRESNPLLADESTVSMNYLARVLSDMGHANEAKALLDRALEHDKALWGPKHPRTAWTLDNLGTVLAGLGKSDAAREAFLRALEIEEQVNGRDHPRTAWTLGNLAGLEWAGGDLTRAADLLRQALQIETLVYGDDNPRTRATARRLASLRRELLELEGSTDEPEP